MAWVRDTGWGVGYINPTPGQLSPHNLHSTPSSLNPVRFLVKENPLERNLRRWLERKLQSATIIYAHGQWSTTMRWSPMLESPPRETTKIVQVTTKPRAKIKTAFPSLEEGQRPTQMCRVCFHPVAHLEKWASVHLSLVKKAHYKVSGFYPDL